MNKDLITEEFLLVLGKKGWVDSSDSIKWQRDWLNRYGKEPLGVARPSSTEEVSKTIILCNKYNIHIVAQGGNTGLVGGGVVNAGNGIVLSLERMDHITSLDELSGIISVQAGVILEHLHRHLFSTDFIFPMHIGSEGSAQIGGLIATNAGGTHAFRFGMMQDLVLGLEVVLADGTVWNGMREVQKDNTGYQLRKLFCGSEGTLGVVTQAVLKLNQKPIKKITALLAVQDSKNLLMLAKKLKTDAGDFLSSMEFFSDVGLGMVLENISGINFPLKNRSPFYMILELSACSIHVPLETILSEIMDSAINKHIVIDGVIAMSEKQRLDIWRLREEQPEAQRLIGFQLKHDISVPPGKLDKFLFDAERECHSILDGVIINSFGHIGDGNVHFNLSPPPGKKNFLNKDDEFALRLGKIAIDFGGSFAAEHGIGRSKIELLNNLGNKTEQDLMKLIKNAMDKKNQLNPGVIFNNEKES